jgi:hypothetical protein
MIWGGQPPRTKGSFMGKAFESIMRSLREIKVHKEIEAYRNDKNISILNKIIDNESEGIKKAAEDILFVMLSKWYPNLFSA